VIAVSSFVIFVDESIVNVVPSTVIESLATAEIVPLTWTDGCGATLRCRANAGVTVAKIKMASERD
jgi:hypothetical protein